MENSLSYKNDTESISDSPNVKSDPVVQYVAQFRRSCVFGKLDEAKSLYHSGIDIHARDDSLFMLVCTFGHLDVAKWLYQLGIENKSLINNYNEAFIQSCGNGHLDVAKWLYQLGIDTNKPFDIDIINKAFYWCRSHEHEHVAIWLHEIGFKLNFFKDI